MTVPIDDNRGPLDADQGPVDQGFVDTPGPITRVHPGMRVVDVLGDEVGTVESVQLGDAGAATPGPEDKGGNDGLLGAIMDAVTTGEGLSERERERLLRAGYLRIDGTGYLGGERYAAAEEIDAVEDDVVRLSVGGAQLIG